jgi:hypothetical protein
VHNWAHENGNDFLKHVHVIVMGRQSPRRGNLAVQYFARLLELEGETARLLYAESISDESKALDLLATRLVDDRASVGFFGNAQRLQIDLLADAAGRYVPKLIPR